MISLILFLPTLQRYEKLRKYAVLANVYYMFAVSLSNSQNLLSDSTETKVDRDLHISQNLNLILS